MLWLRMMLVAFHLAWPDLIAPWRSPLLRWRIETYGLLDPQGRILNADDVSPGRFVQFVLRNRLALLRFLRWAALL
jgi:hypothetical protein